MLTLSEADHQIYQRLAPHLEAVGTIFADELRSDLDCVNDLVQHVERYRGKMLRPTLVLLSAMGCREDADPTPDHQVLATVVEMVHMATLVHDDILDEADMRRRGATINALEGNEAAVMLGDYMISHAYHLCSSIRRTDIARQIAFATNTVCEGELLQLSNRKNWQLDEDTYYELIRRKTASLCGVCCRASAMLCQPEGQGDAARIEAFYAYGEKLGVAFQIVDDLLDLTGDDQTVGKTLGRDLDKGKLTLPLIYILGKTAGPEREAIMELLTRRADEAADEGFRATSVQTLRGLLAEADAVGYARQAAVSLVADAKRALADNLPPSAARDMLTRMADAVVTRKF